MVKYLSKTSSKTYQKIPAIASSELPAFPPDSLAFECWQNYYQDLAKATFLLRSLIK